MTINKALLALALGLVIAACTAAPQPNPQTERHTIAEQLGRETGGLERSVERFSKPDEYGVMCYQDYYNSRNLSCVKVN